MTNNERLDEKLAAIEHQRWADWQRYVHSLCYENKGIGGELTGELTIPSEPLEKEISVEDMQKIVDANEKLVKELKDAKD